MVRTSTGHGWGMGEQGRGWNPEELVVGDPKEGAWSAKGVAGRCPVVTEVSTWLGSLHCTSLHVAGRTSVILDQQISNIPLTY